MSVDNNSGETHHLSILACKYFQMEAECYLHR